jgi:transposase
MARRIWVFDRGIVSEKNLELLRSRGASYIVGTRRATLARFEQELLSQSWENISTELEVKLLPQEQESYILARSSSRRKKELGMRRRKVRDLRLDVRSLQKALLSGRLKNRDAILRRIGVIDERHRSLSRYFTIDVAEDSQLSWKFDAKLFLKELRRDGAYLLRTNLPADDPATLWQQYIQLTDVEASFRALKSELALRPIWHFTERRVQAHIMVAFLGYCLWICLKRRLSVRAPGLTPWQALQQMSSLKLVEVWFQLRNGGALCLERITLPNNTQQLLLDALNWQLPNQPPPRIYEHMLQNVVQTQYTK